MMSAKRFARIWVDELLQVKNMFQFQRLKEKSGVLGVLKGMILFAIMAIIFLPDSLIVPLLFIVSPFVIGLELWDDSFIDQMMEQKTRVESLRMFFVIIVTMVLMWSILITTTVQIPQYAPAFFPTQEFFTFVLFVGVAMATPAFFAILYSQVIILNKIYHMVKPKGVDEGS